MTENQHQVVCLSWLVLQSAGKAKKQSTVALSKAEAEYVALSSAHKRPSG